MLGAGVDEVAVVLHGDDHAELLAVLRALAQAVGHPGLDRLAAARCRRPRASPEGRLRVGEGANHRRAEPRGHLDPGLDAPHALVAHGLVRRGEVVAHAGAADVETEIERVALEPREVAVVRRLRVAGEEVAREVDRVEVLLRAEIAHAEQVDAPAGVLGVLVEQFEEGERVQRETQVRAADSLDRRERRVRGRREAGRRQREQGCTLQERSPRRVVGHRHPPGQRRSAEALQRTGACPCRSPTLRGRAR